MSPVATIGNGAAASSADGLTEDQAQAVLALDGPNELPAAENRSALVIAREVLSEPMFLLLIVAGVLYLLLGDFGDAIMLLLFANLSLGIAVVQQTRSERVLEALRDLAAPSANVIRDGRQSRIDARRLVRGDLIVFGEGERIPADARVVAGAPLDVDESLLTGESVPVRKRDATGDDRAPASPGGDDQPWVFSGTLVVRGQGRGIVTETGQSSAVGSIGRSLASIQTEQPRLHTQTRRLVRTFGLAGFATSMLVVALVWATRGKVVEALLAGIAVSMSLLPEEFPLVLAVFMVMGAWRISRAGVLTRQAAAIESLGAATVVCTDKTGTLTSNHMVVVALTAISDEAQTDGDWRRSERGDPLPAHSRRILEAALLASSRDALDPMDRAVHELAATVVVDVRSWLAARPLERLFGVAPDLPLIATIYSTGETHGLFAAAKGAPEAVASLCRLSPAAHAALLSKVDALAKDGIRVLAVAEAEIAAGRTLVSPRDVEFSLLGLMGFADPVREGVAGAVAECRRAGVRVVMITGDYPATARAIARDAGIEHGEVLSAADLENLDGAQLVSRVRSSQVFARILPEQKLRIVEALKAGGDVVAMIGDGVNDAPALRAAHIGIAMGRRGTDVAREAAKIVLLDDDFVSIVRTLRLGRRIYDNLRKAMAYVVSLHVPIAGLAVLPLLLGMPLTLTPMMIAFLEMIIDPVCSIVFEAESEEANVMSRPPRDPAAALLPPSLLAWCALQGIVAFVLVACVFVVTVELGQPEDEVRSIVFASLVATNIALIFTNRSFHQSALDALSRPNHLVWWAVGTTLLVLAGILAWPSARGLFRMGPMHPHDVALCIGVGLLTFVVLQSAKRWWTRNLTS